MGWLVALVFLWFAVLWPKYKRGEISIGPEMWRRRFRIFKNKKD